LTPSYIVPVEGVPAALHRGENALPFVEFEPGVEMPVLQVDIPSGLWVVRILLQPGAPLATHRHGGEVFARTSTSRPDRSTRCGRCRRTAEPPTSGSRSAART
jgi:hypothetical protein